MADGRKIPYLIELAADDKKIRQQMAKINWEELLGSEGKGFRDVLVSDAQDAKDQIKRTLGGLDIDWSKILGAKEIKQLELAVAKALSKSRKELELFAKSGDTTGLEKTIKYVSALGEELKGLGSNFDADSLARGMIAFMRVLTPLATKIKALADDPKKVEAAFDRLFNGKTSDNMAKVAGGFTVIGDAAGRAAVKVNKSIEIMEAKLASIDAMFSEDYGKKFKFDIDLEQQFYSLDEEIEDVEEKIKELSKKFNGMSSSDKDFDKTRIQLVQLYTEQIELYRKLELVDEEYTRKYSKDASLLRFNAIDPKAVISEVRETIETIVVDAKRQLQSITASTKTTKDGINIPIKLPSQVELVKTINKYVKSINDSDAIHGVRLKLDSGWLNDAANVIEDKTKRAYGDNPADFDKNTTDLVNKTKDRFGQIAGAIKDKQDEIVKQTETWRQQMLDQFKFKSGDFEFQFNNTLIEELQTLFDEYGLKINIDPDYLADQIKNVLEGSNVSLSGGTANIDQESMTAAVMAGVRAALFGEKMPAIATTDKSQERIPDATEQVATDIEQTAKHLDIAEEYVKDVIEKLKAVAKYAVKPADKDTAGTRATREKFALFGIDLERVLSATDDSQILKMLTEEWESNVKDENGNVKKNPGLLQRGEFNQLAGSTVIDELLSFKGSSSNTIPAFVESLREVFYMLQEDTEIVDEWTRKKHSREIFDYARGRAVAANSLRDVRSPIRTGKIPDIEYIDKAIAAMSAIGKNTDSLEALKLAREKLGSKTDEQSIQEFNAVAKEFYTNTTKVFYDIKKQAEDAFKGTIYLQGSKKGIVKKQKIENYRQLAQVGDDDVILDIRVTSSLNNVSLGTTKSKHSDRISPYEERKLLDGKRGDYAVSPEYEADILGRPLEYGGFRPLGVSQTQIDLDGTSNAQQKRIADIDSRILDIRGELESVESKIQLRKQELEHIEKLLGLIGTEPRDYYQSQITDSYRGLFDSLYRHRVHSKVTDESNLPKYNVPSHISDEIGRKKEIQSQLEKIEVLENITVEEAKKRLQNLSERLISDEDMDLYQRAISNGVTDIALSYMSNIEGFSSSEVRKLKEKTIAGIHRAIAEDKKQKDMIDLYSRFIQNPEFIQPERQRLSEELSTTQSNIDSYITTWVQRETEQIPEAERKFKQATQQIVSNIKKIMNDAYDEMASTEEKIKQASSEDEKVVLISKMQDLIRMFVEAQTEYEDFVKQHQIDTEDPLDNSRLKDIDGWRSTYRGSIRQELSYDQAYNRLDYTKLLDQQRFELLQQEQIAISGREMAQALLRRTELTKKYNELLEQSLILTGSITKLESDNAPEEELKKKREELEQLKSKLEEIETQAKTLGGLLGQQDETEYTAEERKAYALDQIAQIDNDLITARAQKSVVSARIAKKDREIAEVDRWGLGAGIGARALNQEKRKVTSEFMDSEYVRSLIDSAREQTKQAIAELTSQSDIAQSDALRRFDDKVSKAMIQEGLSIMSEEQMQAFLETARGKQYSEAYNAEITSIQNTLQKSTHDLWGAYEARIRDMRSQVSAEFKEGMSVDNGVIRYITKIKDESGEWIDQIVEVHVRDTLRQRLVNAKEILEENQSPIQGEIDRLYADRRTAIEYGGVSEKEIFSADVIEDQIRKEENLAKKQEERAESLQRIVDLERSGVADSDESMKRERKKLAQIEKQIAQIEMLIRNRRKLVELRWDESRANSYTDEERELHFTEQVVNYRQKIEDSLARQEELKRKIASASEEEKTKLQYRLSQEEANVTKWRQSIATVEGQLQRIETARSATTATGSSGSSVVTAMKEALGHANIDLTPVTEILQQILAALTGGQVVDNSAYKEAAATMQALEKKYGGKPGAKVVREKKEEETEEEKPHKKSSPKTKYPDEFNFTEALEKQAEEVAKYAKGTKEYILEQAKLYKLLWDYKNNTPELKKLKKADFLARKDIKKFGADPDLINAKEQRVPQYKQAGGMEDIEKLAREFVAGFKVPVEGVTEESKKQLDNAKAETAETKKRTENGKKSDSIRYESDDYKAYKKAKNVVKNHKPNTIQTEGNDTTVGIGALAKDDTLNKILEVLNKIKTDGVKGVGSKAKEKEKKPPKVEKTEAELIKERALIDKDTVLSIAASSKIKKKYMELVQLLEAATDIGDIRKYAQKVSALGFNIKKESAEWDARTSDASRVYDIPNANAFGRRKDTVRKSMERLAQTKFNPDGKQYEFLSFDGTKLVYQLTDIEGHVDRVTMEWSELNNQIAITSDRSVSKLDTLAGKVEAFKGKFEHAIDSGYLGKKDKDLAHFYDAIAKVNDAIAGGESFDRIEQLRNEALRIADQIDKKVAKTKRSYSGTTEINAVTRQRDTMEARGVLDRDDIAMVEQYNAAYSDLMKKYNKFKASGTLFNPKNQKTLQNMAIQVRDLGKQLEKSVAEADQLQQLVDNSGTYRGQRMGGKKILTSDETSNLEASMRSYLKTLGLANAEHVKYDHMHQRLTATQRLSNRAVADLEIKYNEATGALYAYQKAERESLTGIPAFLNGFKKKFNSIMQYLTMTMSIHQVLAQLRRGVQYIREIDLALTELKKVTDETEATYDSFLQSAAKTGERLGSTISAVTEATATFAKLGYSMKQAAEMAEAAIVYKNVGDNIASTEDAADSIISTMKGFRLEASESMAIVDRFNEVGNRFAVTSQGLGEALRLSASALSEGGNSLDESIGLITAANEVVNDPSSVGTALKTLTLRLRGSKTELEEMGEDVSDMATTTSQLQAKLLALTGGQVDIMLDENTFKNSTQILREMADAWEDMNDIQRASALELMGGKRQAMFCPSVQKCA